MTYFAELDENNVVKNIIVTEEKHPDGDKGLGWLQSTFGGQWIECNDEENLGVGSIPKNFAGVGYTFDKNRNAFIAPKPFESWLFDEENLTWKAPIEYPKNGFVYLWDELLVNWKQIEEEGV